MGTDLAFLRPNDKEAPTETDVSPRGPRGKTALRTEAHGGETGYADTPRATLSDGPSAFLARPAAPLDWPAILVP